MSIRQKLRIAGCCAIALLAPFLGGSTERWSEGVILILMALLVGADPPRICGRRGLIHVAVLFACVACTAFLPAAWFGVPAWRQELIRNGVSPGSMVSPQPWVSMECLVLMLGCLLWICWLAAQRWSPEERRLLAGAFVCGAAILSAISLVTFYCKMPVPFWHSERGFGPFPNRNQSGDFFAISGVLALACMYESFRRKKISAVLFAVAAMLICWGLVTSYSRAAVILFFAGSVVWIGFVGFISESKKTVGICASLVVVLAALFLLFGGAMLQRFQSQEKVTLGFRWLIYRDAFTLVRASPWCGTGLGNFEGVFPLFRKESAMSSRILHPESDWLWLWSEMGGVAVIVVAIALGIALKRILPMERGTSRQLRLGAGAAALVFIVHGFVDVPAHRLGSALPGLFMLGLAFNSPAASSENRWLAPCFRIACLVCGAAGATWIFATWQGVALPGSIGVELATQRAQALNAEGEYFDATMEATKAIEWVPLDWKLYFIRGTAEICDGNWPRAYDDFQRVNVLETTSELITYEEGMLWLGSRPSYAIPVWAETLRRCPPQEAAQYYSQMLDAANQVSNLRGLLHPLAEGRTGLEIIYLEHAPGDEARAAISSLLKKDPDLHSLTDEEKIAFLRMWASKGGGADLAQLFWSKPAWQRMAWRPVAQYFAARNDLKEATEAALQGMQQPEFPKITIPGGIGEARRRLLVHNDDFLAGYAVITALMGQNNNGLALEIVRGFTALPDCPKYFYFLEAEIAFRMQDFPAAWKALQKYEPVAG
ncbi:MAG: O-antigen ligase family protein [Chthoniobacteraceae bacterium]